MRVARGTLIVGDRSTAVCAGAAMGGVTEPDLRTLLPQLTIGLQTANRTADFGTTRTTWKGASTAKVLFSQGYAHPREYSTDHLIPLNAASSRRLRFEFVADPNYQTDRNRRQLSDLPDIQINPPRKMRTDHPVSVYDMGCQLHAGDLPSGKVRFALSGRRFALFSEGLIDEAIVTGDNSLPIILKCFNISRSSEPVKSAADRKFVLWIRADPATRHPIIAQEEDFKKFELPFWCSYCNEEIEGNAEENFGRTCKECRFSLCWTCAIRFESDELDHNHPAEHETERIDIDF